MTSQTTSYANESVLRPLVGAPIGPYPMVEAAFAWHERRPPDWHQRGPGGARAQSRSERFTTVIETDSSAAVSRMVRILSATTWAVGNQSVHGFGPTSVDVPAAVYHRVVRVLQASGRAGRQMLSDPTCPAEVALGVWRMAVLLVDRSEADPNYLPVQVNSAAALRMLMSAGDLLGLAYSVRRVRGAGTIVSADPVRLFVGSFRSRRPWRDHPA